MRKTKPTPATAPEAAPINTRQIPTPAQIAKYRDEQSAPEDREAILIETAYSLHGAALEAHRRAQIAARGKPDEAAKIPAIPSWEASVEAARTLLEADPVPPAASAPAPAPVES